VQRIKHTVTYRILYLVVLFSIYVVVISMDPATPSNTINAHSSCFSANS